MRLYARRSDRLINGSRTHVKLGQWVGLLALVASVYPYKSEDAYIGVPLQKLNLSRVLSSLCHIGGSLQENNNYKRGD
jgi:hypothetical protein